MFKATLPVFRYRYKVGHLFVITIKRQGNAGQMPSLMHSLFRIRNRRNFSVVYYCADRIKFLLLCELIDTCVLVR
ncbi:hypothetical protein A5659_18570 [Mycobacterium sp. 1165196.3]|nr:hypothetical protein A5659_18570 [Mycobacterium sp. 1165196.3]